jgi:hypothetical protein
LPQNSAVREQVRFSSNTFKINTLKKRGREGAEDGGTDRAHH